MSASVRAAAVVARRPLSFLAALVTLLVAPVAAHAAPSRIEAERMHVTGGARHVVRDAAASAGRALVLRAGVRAGARLSLRARSRVVVAARGVRCRRAPRVRVTVDGRTALLRQAPAATWGALTSRRVIRSGRHRVAVRLARSRGCRHGVRIDAVALVRARPAAEPPAASAPATPAPAPAPAPAIWRPAPNTTWQWQLTTPVDLSVPAQMYDIDLFNNGAEVVSAVHASGRRAVCYLSAGTWEPGRPDSGAFPAAVLGSAVSGWPDERWLDIRRLDILGPIMERRLDLCRARGFDGVEPDNVDGYGNGTGFPLSAADQLAYNRFLVSAAHARGLSIGLKNDLEQVAELQPIYDWALDEECFANSECQLLQPFVQAGKAVFNVEYDLDPASFCPQARSMGFMSMRKELALDAARTPCW
jgi:hypothetical protein